MFNLLMVGRDGYWDEREVAEMEEARFLEHTQVHIRDQFTPINQDVLEKLQTLPTLFAYEFPREARYRNDDDVKARVGRLLEFRHRGRSLDFKFELSTNSSTLSSEKMAELAWELDINVNGNESHRTHWSVKPGELSSIFQHAKLKLEKRIAISPGHPPQRVATKPKGTKRPKEHPVQQDDLGLGLRDARQSLLAVDRLVYAEALFLEVVAQHGRQRLLVLDREDRGFALLPTIADIKAPRCLRTFRLLAAGRRHTPSRCPSAALRKAPGP